MLSRISIILAIISTVMLGGCASTQTMIQHRNLSIDSKMSDTIFLDPIAPNKKIVLVQFRNTSDKLDFNPSESIKSALSRAGYVITDDPDNAHLVLQANILKISPAEKDDANRILLSGYGGALEGALSGALIGTYSSSRNSLLTGGLVGAVVGTVADSLIKDVAYSVVTDIQISERIDGIIVTEQLNSKLKQGAAGSKTITSTETTSWKRYQTRLVSTADKVNLKFEDAKEELLASMTQSISGIFI